MAKTDNVKRDIDKLRRNTRKRLSELQDKETRRELQERRK